MSTMQSLAEQIWRITESSYPTSLTILDKLLASEQDHVCYQSLALRNPCLIHKLARHAASELSQGGHSLSIILKLAKLQTFAHTLISFNPQLLEYVISTTLSKNFAADLHLDLALALLSYPLPTNILLPSCSEPLFLHLSTVSYQTPSLNTILAFYDVLNGACNQLPSILPKETLLEIVNNLVKIIKSPTSSLHDQEWPLVCLGILALLNQDHNEPRLSQLSSQFFSASGNKVYSTLNLAVVQAVFHSKDKTQASVGDVLKRLNIAIQILEKTDRKTRQSWAASQAGKDNVQRLRRCLESDEISQCGVRMKLWILLSLIREPALEVISYFKFLKQLVSTTSSAGQDLDCMRTLASIYMPLISSTTVQFLLEHAVHVLQKKTHATFESTQALYIHISTLLDALEASETPRKAIYAVLDANSVIIQQVFDLNLHESSCTRSIPCGLFSAKHHSSLLASLIEIIIQVSTTSKQSSLVSTSQASHFLRRLKDIASRNQECETLLRIGSARISNMGLIKDVNNSNHGTLPWKEKVRLFIQRESAVQVDATEALIREICGDLVHVQAPFHAEQTRTAMLEGILAEATEEAKDLQRQIVDRDIVIRELQNDKMAASQCQSQLQNENHHLQNTLHELETQIRDLTAARNGLVVRLEKEISDLSLDLKALNTTTTGRIEGLTKQLATSESANQELLAKTIANEQKIVGYHNEMQRLQVEANGCLADKGRQENDLRSVREEKEVLLNEVDSSRKHSEDLSRQLAEATLKLDASRQQLSVEITARERLQEIDASQRTNIENLQKQYHRNEKALESRLEEAFSAFKEEKATLMSALDQKESVLNNLEQDVDHLNKFIERQDAMILGLRNMKNIGGGLSSLGEAKAHQTRRQTRALVVETPGSLCRINERGLKPEHVVVSVVNEEAEDMQEAVKSGRKRYRTPRKQPDRTPKLSKLEMGSTRYSHAEEEVTQTTKSRKAMDDITLKRNGAPTKGKKRVFEKEGLNNSDSFGLSSIEFQSTQVSSLEGGS